MQYSLDFARKVRPAPGALGFDRDLRTAGGSIDARAYARLHWRLACWVDLSCRGSHVSQADLARLPLPADVAATMRRIMTQADTTMANAAAIADVWLNLARLRRVRREQPRLWPLVGLVAASGLLTLQADPVAQVKAHFRGAGVSGRVWRLLAARGFAGVAGICRIAAGDRLTAIRHWLISLSQTDADWLPGTDVMAALYASVEPDLRGRREIHLTRFLGKDGPFLRSALRAARTCMSDGTLENFLRDDLARAERWWRTELPDLDANQTHAGWGWIMARTAAWEARELERRRRESTPLCRPAVDRFDLGAHQAHAVTTALALWDEGDALRNCLETYEARVARGDVLIYSIRTAADGKRKACAEFRRDPADQRRWAFTIARIFANQPATPAIEHFCRRLEGVINDAATCRGGDAGRACAGAAANNEARAHAPFPACVAGAGLDAADARLAA